MVASAPLSHLSKSYSIMMPLITVIKYVRITKKMTLMYVMGNVRYGFAMLSDRFVSWS